MLVIDNPLLANDPDSAISTKLVPGKALAEIWGLKIPLTACTKVTPESEIFSCEGYKINIVELSILTT